MINREDMLELTRRMNVSRNCFSRIAGAYMDREGFEDSSFNVHFLSLSASDRAKNLEIAKTVPFARTNEQLREYSFPIGAKDSLRQLLTAIRKSGLKDDGLLSVLYELIGEAYRASGDYAIYLFFGTYDIPVKAGDKERLEDSEEVYEFLILAIAPLVGDYELGTPEFGFLYPAFSDRSSDIDRIDIYDIRGQAQEGLLERILGDTGSLSV